ncbi:hypothetical protein CJ030_MR2G012873 [Morella rubra]|uniref:Uncharacterized protein n=1 Tax=Morella rubra TaxID=262757 RepID=A0A6A1WJG7_9ROSI|nr:hypothetical protein CJ030_MR2G012873 [Morella rubra]
MKLLALFLVLMLLAASSCLAVPRRFMLGGIYGQQQRYHVRKGKAVESRTGQSKIQYTESTSNNNLDHHTIPRNKFHDWDTTSQGEEGDSNNGGSG